MTKEQIEANKAKLAECYGKEYMYDGKKVKIIGINRRGNPCIESDWLATSCNWKELTEIKEPRIIFEIKTSTNTVYEEMKAPYIPTNLVAQFIELTPEIKDKLGIE